MVYNRKNRQYVKTIKLSDDSETSDDKIIAEEFKKYFKDKPLNIHSNIDKPILNYDYLIPNNNISMLMQMTTVLQQKL
jgi:hypothetical protein